MVIDINAEKDIMKARTGGRNRLRDMNAGAIDQARVLSAISELARNIYLYAGNGRLTLEIIEEPAGKRGVRLTAEDHGPGISMVNKALEKGYSTSGGLGAGLPGVKNMMDEFDIDSTPGKGTKVTVLKWIS